MKSTTFLLSAIVASVSAAPAVVWMNQNGANKLENTPLRTSESLKAYDLLTDILSGKPSEDSSLAAVVFLIDRSEDGSETFSKLASSGQLPLTQAKYDYADSIHHHVSGIESPHTMVRDASRASPDYSVVQVNLSEFSNKLASLEEPDRIAEVEVTQQSNGIIMSKAAKHSNKRARSIKDADVLMVHVHANSACEEVDAAISNAIEHSLISSVVVAGIRSTEEVKHERNVAAQRQRTRMVEMTNKRKSSIFFPNGARRLEDQQGDDDADNNNNNNNDLSGVYYVHMTPNILSGVMFFFLFSVVTWIGISCMGMIAGQDVYVNKMPAIGREA